VSRDCTTSSTITPIPGSASSCFACLPRQRPRAEPLSPPRCCPYHEGRSNAGASATCEEVTCTAS
jgi:hypothetical protein